MYAAALAIGLATAITPAPAPGADVPVRLVISRAHVHPGDVKSWSLKCAPTGGSHPAAEKACAMLRAIRGDLDKIRPRPGLVCTTEHDPYDVRIRGVYDGRPVVFAQRYANGCVLEGSAAPIVPHDGPR
ncbi:SSI family serine proteinase inhibitor [Sphaerisporangium sp. NPDC051011]|uniref:SSI family serine proteinase inhibitor n=1 Tax=Sphaerisporangium sp. NPDC051011 TaxID=3155792 RepID=UPI0033F7A5B5